MNICDMKLHYSQTLFLSRYQEYLFYYHTKLHYFQTSIVVPVYLSLFYYHTKLHLVLCQDLVQVKMRFSSS